MSNQDQMGRTELVRRVAAKTSKPQSEVDLVVKMTLGEIQEALRSGEAIALPGFGTFRVADQPARTGRNPKTGAPIEIPARKAVKFKPAQALKEAVNG